VAAGESPGSNSSQGAALRIRDPGLLWSWTRASNPAKRDCWKTTAFGPTRFWVGRGTTEHRLRYGRCVRVSGDGELTDETGD